MTKFLLPLALVAVLTMQTTAGAYDLSPGKPFPPFALPSIRNGEEIDFKEQLGEKLMLHLFASW